MRLFGLTKMRGISLIFLFIGLLLSDISAIGQEINLSGSIDWKKFVSLCSNHFILPSIYLKFKRNDIIKYLQGYNQEKMIQFINNNVRLTSHSSWRANRRRAESLGEVVSNYNLRLRQLGGFNKQFQRSGTFARSLIPVR